MKFEYCAIFYTLNTKRGEFDIRPSNLPPEMSKDFIIYDALNILGGLGWELICSMPDATGMKLYLIFKRAIPA